MKTRTMICTMCPNGCELHIRYRDRTVDEVTGWLCRKGVEYAEAEVEHPMRIVTTTVEVEGGRSPLVSVRSDRPVPKESVPAVVRYLKTLSLRGPIAFHQTIAENVLDTGASIIATSEST